MAGYLIIQVEVKDDDAYAAYKAQASPTLAAYGGEFVVRGGDMEVLEGTWPMRRNVVIRFASVARAKAWYDSPEYAGPKALRQAASDANIIVVEGI